MKLNRLEIDSMSPKEDAIEIVEYINGQSISLKDWGICSKYAKIELKRKAKYVVDKVLCVVCAIDGTEHFQKYYEEVRKEIEKL